MTRNLNPFSRFEQYPIPASFRKEFEKKCATYDTSNTPIVQLIDVVKATSNLFIYFDEKISHAQKSIKRKQATFTLLELCAQKTVAFVVLCLLIFVLLAGFCLCVFLSV